MKGLSAMKRTASTSSNILAVSSATTALSAKQVIVHSFGSPLFSVTLRREPTGPVRKGRPDDRLHEPRRGDSRHVLACILRGPLCARAPQDDDLVARDQLTIFQAMVSPPR